MEYTAFTTEGYMLVTKAKTYEKAVEQIMAQLEVGEKLDGEITPL